MERAYKMNSHTHGIRELGCRRRDIDRAGAVIGKTCLSILQSIIERHCHVNGNRIEIAMEMALCSDAR